MKHARTLHGAGRVSEASYVDGTLSGYVREGETKFKAGLRIVSKTNMENLCTCRDSKQRGAICAHSIAVGLETLKPTQILTPVIEKSSEKGEPPAVRPLLQPGPESAQVTKVHQVEGFSLQDGVPVELHVVIPPNFIQASARGVASLGVEAESRGKRVLLHALDTAQIYRCSEADMRLLEALAGLNPGGALQGMLSLNTESLIRLLEAVTSHPRVSLARRVPLNVSADSLAPALFANTLPNGDLVLRCELPSRGVLLNGNKTAWFFRDNVVQPVCEGLPAVYLGLLLDEVLVPSAAVPSFLQKEWGEIAKRFSCEKVTLPQSAVSIEGKHKELGLEGSKVAPLIPEFVLRLEGSLNFLSGKLQAGYGDFRTTLSSLPTGSRICNPMAESAALRKLSECGFSAPDAEGQMALKGEPTILEFFARHLPGLKRQWKVELGERFEFVTRNIERIEPKLRVVGSGENWFEMDVALEAENGERYSGVEIRRLIQSGRSHLRRKDGSVAVFDPVTLDEFDQVLRDCNPDQRQPGRYRIANRQAGFVEAFVQESGAGLQAPASWRRWAGAARQASEWREVPLGVLDSQLRAYQKQGVYWMHFLAENGFAGILADEMGLGKTVQALAFLGTLKGGRSLVVAPSSLLTNWQRETERFLPGKRIVVLSGVSRHAQELSGADVVITSYPLLRLDADRLCRENFAAVVLDEAQHIKNPESQAAQAAFRLRAQRRFVLTGTPVENSVRDVWSLFHFLMPGYLGTKVDFRERYEVPISQEPGGKEHKRLIQRLAPFLLRRTKRAVAPELPDKIEQVVWCELSTAQREMYSKLMDLSRREVGKAEELKNKGQARMLMLTALLRLRQACNDLRLLGEDFSGSEAESSGKLDALEELLTEAIDGGHRLLLFSQFSSMLDLLQEWLELRNITFCRLDGSTRDRVAQVDRFQRGEVPVFLISLKAGGVGLTLTAADTVVHFDPWWNPAVEAQATDRAHRIGQKSTVTSYKLIMRGTVEEKILQLQERKRNLMDALVESEQPLMDGLSMEDIADLLQG